jgi:hypothetical protein
MIKIILCQLLIIQKNNNKFSIYWNYFDADLIKNSGIIGKIGKVNYNFVRI